MDKPFPFEIPEFDYTIIDNREDVGEKFLQRVGRHDLYSLDFETTGLNYMLDRAAAISIATLDHSWYFNEPAMHQVLPWLKDNMANSNTSWIAHNMKFELHFFTQLGFNIQPINIIDTEIAQWMLNEEDTLKLKELGFKVGVKEKLPSFRDLQRYAKDINPDIKKLKDVTLEDIPLPIMGKYGAFDSRLAFDLWLVLRDELINEGLLNIFFEKEMPLLKVLLRMERKGIKVDLEKTEILLKKYTEKRDILYEKFEKIIGHEVNPNSPTQLRKLLFEEMKLKSKRKTPSGLLSTDELTLIRLKRQDKTGAIETLLEYRDYQKLITTYLKAILEKNIDGRIHTNFNQTGTVNGRFSSSGAKSGVGVNLQNIPKRGEKGKEIRSLFIAPDGKLILRTDESQLEMRLIGHYSRDRALVRAYMWKVDVHQLTADGLHTDRYRGKQVNYSTAYGGWARTICDQIEKDGYPRPNENEIKEMLIKFYNELYPAINPWKDEVIREARLYKYITLLSGRHKHANMRMLDHWDKYKRWREERRLVNGKIQGSAADILNEAMIVIDDYQNSLGADMLIQVHDELVWECDKDQIHKFKERSTKDMEDVGNYFGVTIPIIAEPNIGPSWMESKN